MKKEQSRLAKDTYNEHSSLADYLAQVKCGESIPAHFIAFLIWYRYLCNMYDRHNAKY